MGLKDNLTKHIPKISKRNIGIACGYKTRISIHITLILDKLISCFLLCYTIFISFNLILNYFHIYWHITKNDWCYINASFYANYFYSVLFEIWTECHPFEILQNQTFSRVWFCIIANGWSSLQISNRKEIGTKKLWVELPFLAFVKEKKEAYKDNEN